MNYHIRLTESTDAVAVAQHMRVRDVQEIQASSGLLPLEALSLSVKHSTQCWTVEDESGPFVIFGVAPYLPDVGSPWLLATDTLRRYARSLIRETRAHVLKMHNEYSMLVNFVDQRNTDSISYLKACGFTVDKLIPAFGHEQRPFHRFFKVI